MSNKGMDVEKRCVEALCAELIPAFGCTEPIAIAYGAARARQLLGTLPQGVVVFCSGNIIKNVKGVVVPATGNLIGIPAAAAIGITGGDPNEGLEVLKNVGESEILAAKRLIEQNVIRVKKLDTEAKLHIQVEMWNATDRVMVEIMHTHMNIVREEKNGKILFQVPQVQQEDHTGDELANLTLADLYETALHGNLGPVQKLLEQQIVYNSAISQEGLQHNYGAQVGRTLLQMYGGEKVEVLAQAAAAAGSDARMGGCEMPVMINSGSGNQGLTVCMPVVVYAKHVKADRQTLYRALWLANLVAIYQRSKIGRLSAFCGVVNASAGAAAGIAFLLGANQQQIEDAIVNTLANVGGIVCDGAKASCAAKISSGVGAAILGVQMALQNTSFLAGQGLVKKTPDSSVDCFITLARDGFYDIDEEILKLMMQQC